MIEPLTIYFAGDLFDHKDLIGNALLASYIDRVSEGRYQCVLPQDFEVAAGRAKEIRDNDLKQVLKCDLALFNFDGSELDSGTVVEYIYAKFLDKPAVILRTDFRASGDQEEGDPWNLMCSFYPRTKILQFNAMAQYHRAKSESLGLTIDSIYRDMAAKIVVSFDEVCQEESPLEKSGIDPAVIQQWATTFPGI